MKYRYLIYKIYSWSANKGGDTPVANTILTLATVHFFQFVILFIFIDQIITPIRWIYDFNKFFIFFGALIYFVLFYFLVYNKKRWDSYIEEYKNENEEKRKKGNYMVIGFLAGSILLFFISLPVLFTLGKMKNP